MRQAWRWIGAAMVAGSTLAACGVGGGGRGVSTGASAGGSATSRASEAASKLNEAYDLHCEVAPSVIKSDWERQAPDAEVYCNTGDGQVDGPSDVNGPPQVWLYFYDSGNGDGALEDVAARKCASGGPWTFLHGEGWWARAEYYFADAGEIVDYSGAMNQVKDVLGGRLDGRLC